MTHQQIIEKWSTREELAQDIGARSGTVRAWHMRERIPVVWWMRIIAASKKRRFGVTFKQLLETIDREIQEGK